MKKKLYITLSVVLLLCVKLKAQEFNTNESISSQMKNNKVPGAKYAPATTTNAVKSKGFEGSSLAKAYLDGTVKGIQFSTSAPAASPTATNSTKAFGLASEISSVEAKAAQDKAVKETQAKPIVQPNLTQEPKKE
jgi:hypothetical protein